MKRVVIVGGGISGLAAAYRLHRLAPNVEVVLLEARNRLGGVIETDRADGFVVEGGPDSFLARKPRGIGLCQELGMAARLIEPNSDRRRTWVMHSGHLYDMPQGLSGLVPSRLEPLLESPLFSPEGKARLQREPDIAPRANDGDETLAEFIERRFGREAYDRLIEPLMAGIYAGDGDLLSLQATFPQLGELEQRFGSVLRGIQQQQGVANSAGKAAFLTPRCGMEEIVDGLSRALFRADMRLGYAASRVEESSGGFRIHVLNENPIDAQSIILAVPAYVAAELVGDTEPLLAHELSAIPYASTATVALAFPLNQIPRPLDGFGYVVPRIENRPVLASTWVSTKFANRAPEGYALIRVFLGRYGRGDVLNRPDEELIALARAELGDVLGIRAAPERHWIFRWPRAMPQFVLGHLERLEQIEQIVDGIPGLFLAGALRGVGVPDCIASGETAAENAATFLK